MLIQPKVDKVLVYYDRPLLFTAFDDAGREYLVTLAEEHQDGSETWICAPVTLEQVADIESGKMDLRAGFSGRPLININVASDGVITEVETNVVPEKWLPSPGAFLLSASEVKQ